MQMGHDKQRGEILLPRGMEIDIEEGWRKLINRQFPGDPARAFGELIQNLLDSYPSNTPFEERKGEVVTEKNKIAITDYGEGMSRSRVKLLLTLGGTDKRDDNTKIGTFGIGFFSVFNPALGAREVRVTTRCEGQVVEILFRVLHPGKLPEISTMVLTQDIPFSSRIEVVFDNAASPERCLVHARECLRYYPCQININGLPYSSVWEKALSEGLEVFRKGHCHGFLHPAGRSAEIQVLCKYEAVLKGPLPLILTGGRDMSYDLRDYFQKEFPILPHIGAVINWDNLRLTIARDSYYINEESEGMIQELSGRYMQVLGRSLDASPDPQLVLANQYVLRRPISRFLAAPADRENRKNASYAEGVIGKLAHARVYRLYGKEELYSLADLRDMRTKGLPLFFSPNQLNVRWLGGLFKHDFVLLPPGCTLGGGAPYFYDSLFRETLGDAVNLDTIQGDNHRLKDLVKRGIVSEEWLSPKVAFTQECELEDREEALLKEVDLLLSDEGVREAITKHLHLTVREIHTLYFDFVEEGFKILTGLFGGDGSPVSAPPEMNLHFLRRGHDDQADPENITLGLCRNHPLVQDLIQTQDPHRAYYTLTLLASELAHNQKLLVPHSPFFHLVKGKVTRDMRRALIARLLSESSGNSARPAMESRGTG